MECRNFSAAFRKRGDRIKYSLSGDMIQHKTKKMKKGEIAVKGVIQLGQGGASHHSIEIDNLDLSLFNNHIAEYFRKNLSLTGGFSASVKIDRENGAYTCLGELSTSSLNVASTGADQFEIISNGNFNTDFNLKYSEADGLFEIGKLRLYDDNLDVLLSGKKITTEKDNIFVLRIGTEKMDLDELSAYIKPAKDCAYRGETVLFADIYLDLNNDARNYIALEGTVRDLGVSFSRNGIWKDLISGCSGQVSVKNRKAHVSATIQASSSDFTIDLQSAFETYMPLKSASRLSVSSKTTQIPLVFEVFNRAVTCIFDSAYEDEKFGYDDIFFLKKPESAIVNSNDLTLECHVDRLAFNEKAALRNLSLKSSLLKGVFSVDNFSLEGFDGIYSLQAQCFFNRDYPGISIKGGVKDFDLGRLSSEMKAPYTFSGKMNIDFDYELTAYRMLQVLQNSRGNLNISLSNGAISETPGQKSFAAYLEKSGPIRASLATLSITSLSMGLTQGADSFMIRSFSCTGDPLSYSGYGTYNYQNGLNIPVSATIKDREGKTQSAQFVITGRLIDPVIQMKAKNAANYALFSDTHL
jgi:hypothetical protein